MTNQPNHLEGAPERPLATTDRARAVGRGVVVTSWVLNAALLLATLAWVYLDGSAPRSLGQLSERLRAFVETFQDRWTWRDGGLAIGVGVFAMTSLVVLGSIFVGPRRFRRLHAWLAFIGLTCVWLWLATSWSNIYWDGQQTRIARDLPALSHFADELISRWPRGDAEIEDVGPVIAYPLHAPTTLLALGTPNIPGTRLRFAAVDRSNEDAVRIELAGAESGVWLERRDGPPTPSFTDGLQTHYDLERFAPLGRDWFLVRYASLSAAADRG